MKRIKSVLLSVLFSALLFIGLAACQTPAGRSMGEVVDDSTITTEVKAKIFDDKSLNGFAISVETFEGSVTLTGAVDNFGQKERARKVALGVRGVQSVNNLLKIKSPQ